MMLVKEVDGRGGSDVEMMRGERERDYVNEMYD